MAARHEVPPGASFAFDIGRASLDEQLRRIDALDTKAGVLIAADGILAGLVLGSPTFVGRASRPVAVGWMATLILSLLFGLAAIATRRYEFAPTAEAVIRFIRHDEDWLKWRFLGNLARALEVNGRKLAWKTRALSAALASLIAAVGLSGGYFLYALAIRGR